MTMPMRLLAACLVVALLGSVPHPAEATLTVVPRGTKMDTNFPGRDLRSFKAEDAMRCAEVCDRTQRCMAWTWVRPGVQGAQGMCWLKDGAPAVVKDRCCMSGLREPSGRPELQVNRPGMDYRSFDLPRPVAGLCEEACLRERACRAWTYVLPQGANPAARCWLKKDVPNPVADGCCTSGVNSRR